MTEKIGFAPAAAPHASTIVSTPEEAITAGETSIPSQGENMPAYHARPKSADGPLPIVIVVQEIFGVHEHIRDLCRRLALEGYLAVAWSTKCRTRRCWPISTTLPAGQRATVAMRIV